MTWPTNPDVGEPGPWTAATTRSDCAVGAGSVFENSDVLPGESVAVAEA